MSILKRKRKAAGLTVYRLQKNSGVANASIYLFEDTPDSMPQMRLKTAVALLNFVPGLTLKDLLRADPGRIKIR